MKKLILAKFILILSCSISIFGQKPEVTISLNETFFDALLDSVFTNFEPPEFSFANTPADSDVFFLSAALKPVNTCTETIKLQREMRGVRTAVRFRDGKVIAPLAFTGTYSAPLLGCIEFGGWAESILDLEFDQPSQKLIARIRVTNVNLNGTGGLGGSMVAKLVQGSIDKKLNPLEVLSLDKVSFGLPISGAGSLRMRAHRIRPEVGPGYLNVRVEYDFVKS